MSINVPRQVAGMVFCCYIFDWAFPFWGLDPAINTILHVLGSGTSITAFYVDTSLKTFEHTLKNHSFLIPYFYLPTPRKNA
jgi:hypothetical protein